MLIRRLSSALRADWRTLTALGVGLGTALGLAGFLLLDAWWWLPLWVLLLLGLTWLGWDAEPRLAQALVPTPTTPPPPPGPRALRDGPFVMVELPGGDFLMGSPDGDRMSYEDERPAHRVRVSGFRIARTPVTRGLWHDLMGGGAAPDDPEWPATGLDWDDAIRFCNRLSRRQGYRPCYRRRGLWPRRRWHCDWDAQGYRLPTEAEWEYACRAGTGTTWFWGEDPAGADPFAWYGGNSGGRLRPVGTKAHNPWGLHDMAGLVWEWCWDRYGPYPALGQTDPRGAAGGVRRVVRGGSFFVPPGLLRPAGRDGVQPDARNVDLGLRCVRSRARQH